MIRVGSSAMLLLLATTQNAYAYIDPGSGMLLIQGLLAAIAAAIAFVTHPIQTIKNMLNNMKKKKLKRNQNDKPEE